MAVVSLAEQEKLPEGPQNVEMEDPVKCHYVKSQSTLEEHRGSIQLITLS